MLRFRRATKPCPGCGQLKVLAFYDARRRASCARCTGQDPVYACVECGREDSPFGRKCAPCALRERLSDLLADPGGLIHPRLRPVFDALMAAPRPQSVHYWLTRPSGRPDLLRAMARGEMEISHRAFEQLTPDRAVIYVRDLLAAVGVLEPYQSSLERITPWPRDTLSSVPGAHAELIDRFARWQLLRRLRLLEHRGQITRGSVQNTRATILASIGFLDWLDSQHTSLATLTQHQLDSYLICHPGKARSIEAFLGWTHRTRLSGALQIPAAVKPQPHVTLGDERRWSQVERLLHDTSIRHYVRVAGLFLLLFAQPLARVCRMTHDQIVITDADVAVRFDTTPVALPDPLDRLAVDQHAHATDDRYANHRSAWLFPGRHAGRALASENFRAQLVAIGIQPNQARKAAMFQLAAEMPAPILADLLGLAPATASRWAALAARDWSQYTAMRRNAGEGARLIVQSGTETTPMPCEQPPIPERDVATSPLVMTKEPLIHELVGEQLSSVIFVGDYVQLEFNGPRLSAYVWPKVVTQQSMHAFGDPGYRDLLCSFIDHDVEGAQDTTQTGIVLQFAVGSIVINPQPSDLTGPEIAMLSGFQDTPRWAIWRPGEDTFAGRDWS